MNTKNSTNIRLFDMLLIGKQYVFKYTHRPAGAGIVCELDRHKQTVVVYDLASKGYELVPIRRLLSCERLG